LESREGVLFMRGNGIEYTPENLPAEIRNDAGHVFSKMNEFSEFLKQSSGTMSQASNMLKQATEFLQSARDIRKIDVMEKTIITEITKKYDTYRNVFGTLFAQRDRAIDKYFEVIDKGMRENDNQLIIAGLQKLSDTVKASPFADFKSFKESFNNGTLPPI
jgi:hypothetical protein